MQGLSGVSAKAVGQLTVYEESGGSPSQMVQMARQIGLAGRGNRYHIPGSPQGLMRRTFPYFRRLNRIHQRDGTMAHRLYSYRRQFNLRQRPGWSDRLLSSPRAVRRNPPQPVDMLIGPKGFPSRINTVSRLTGRSDGYRSRQTRLRKLAGQGDQSKCQ